jgi:EPS-associated MarR family transcriptional regulator
MPSRQSKQQEDTRFRLLWLLQENPKLNQRGLSKALGLSLGSINYSLQDLLNKEWITMQPFESSNGKLLFSYPLTSLGAEAKDALAERFLLRKIEECALLQAEIETLQKITASNATAMA